MGTDHVFTMTRASWEDERGRRDETEMLKSDSERPFSFLADAVVPFSLTFKEKELWTTSKYLDCSPKKHFNSL